MRIMLDTNILISAALFPNGRAAQAFFKALSVPYQPIVCDYVVDELHRKFEEKFPHNIGAAFEEIHWMLRGCQRQPPHTAGGGGRYDADKT